MTLSWGMGYCLSSSFQQPSPCQRGTRVHASSHARMATVTARRPWMMGWMYSYVRYVQAVRQPCCHGCTDIYQVSTYRAAVRSKSAPHEGTRAHTRYGTYMQLRVLSSSMYGCMYLGIVTPTPSMRCDGARSSANVLLAWMGLPSALARLRGGGGGGRLFSVCLFACRFVPRAATTQKGRKQPVAERRGGDQPWLALLGRGG